MNQRHPAYEALQTGIALFDRSDRMRLNVAGPDRVKFLHNLTTNDVKRLAVGSGHESFVTTLQGKTLGYVTVLACDDHLLLRSDPGALDGLLPHLQKYSVFDDATLEDFGPTTFEYHLAGPGTEELGRLLEVELPAAKDLSHCLGQIGSMSVLVVREAPTGRAGVTLIGAVEHGPKLIAHLRAAGEPLGLVLGDATTFEAARVEAGTPCYGKDVTLDNLPQEIGRDTRAINFVKGCYLGQETVARIDALGHVNKHLRGLRFPPGPAPAVGSAVAMGGKSVGTITSVADSLGSLGPIALGYLRTAAATPGTKVEVGQGDDQVIAVVTELPMLPEVPPAGTPRN